MSEFSQYMFQKEHKARAFAEYNYASLKLEVAGIKERLAETRSQHEPYSKLTKEILKITTSPDSLKVEDKIRAVLDRAATYVVCNSVNI